MFFLMTLLLILPPILMLLSLIFYPESFQYDITPSRISIDGNSLNHHPH